VKEQEAPHAGTDHGGKGGDPGTAGHEDRGPGRRAEGKTSPWAGEGDLLAGLEGDQRGGEPSLRNVANAEGQGCLLGARGERVVPLEPLAVEAYVLPGAKSEPLRPGQPELEGVGREPAGLLEAGPVFLRTYRGRGSRFQGSQSVSANP
jgi:hypothetical protein